MIHIHHLSTAQKITDRIVELYDCKTLHYWTLLYSDSVIHISTINFNVDHLLDLCKDYVKMYCTQHVLHELPRMAERKWFNK